MTPRGAMLAVAIWMAGAVPVFAHHLTPTLQIEVGMKLALYQPESLLLLAACGLWISFWERSCALIGLAWLLAGLLLGFPLVFIWQVNMIWIALVLTALFGGAVALNYFLPKQMRQGYLVLAGACCAPLGFIGHSYDETLPFLLGGYVFSLMMVAALAYLVCAALREQSERHRWMAIVLRVFGSWAFAAAFMTFAFYVVGPTV